ncbi:uncharacterized protein DNG_05453 [Cephalotrichum gorgonifer]|uniref:Uncharacterized protein n=1 Tax=Cephalotrichum gorgonifer TaxID=2041049 RepID=A0AAE8MZX3_9PEZI|nr:uncharacterized protein DNG_05453 [Cephalotrichum gorgonifer]
MDRLAARRLLAISSRTLARTNVFVPRTGSICQTRANTTLPNVAETGFWTSLVPKPFRRSVGPNGAPIPKTKSKGWNPATFFIVIFIFIGSASINTIAVRNDNANFMRQADVRIGLLREVVEKLQRGEKVDVEQALGTGDPAREKEWEEMMREIENDRATRDSRKPEKPKAAEEPKPTTKAATTHEPPSPPTVVATPSRRGSSSSFY